VIRNACIHVQNEQPLIADLFEVPTSADAGMLCTNLRTMDGKRPVFIDSIEATFFFPYHVIRFIEIPEGALERHDPAPAREGGADARQEAPAEVGGALPEEQRLPVPVAAAGGDEPGDDLELEIDEEFLQRIRDI
jgi:hypothetical protein